MDGLVGQFFEDEEHSGQPRHVEQREDVRDADFLELARECDPVGPGQGGGGRVGAEQVDPIAALREGEERLGAKDPQGADDGAGRSVRVFPPLA